MSAFDFTSTNPAGDYSHKIGNSKSYPVRALRSDGVTPIDITGASFKFCLRALPLELTAELEKTFGSAYPNPDPSFITIVSASTGDFKFNLKPVDTKLLAPRIVTHDLEITEVDGTVSTILAGNYELADHASRGN